MTTQRTIFFISDGTGITAETIGHTLLSQFENLSFNTTTLPYIDTEPKAQAAVDAINACHGDPLIFTTIVDPHLRKIIDAAQGRVLDLFEAFLSPIETALEAKSSYTVGRSHSAEDIESYTTRIDAMNYALANDDGLGTHNYDKADIILLGVSRSGKTPTCLYLALQFGIYAANYPITEEDFEKHDLPNALKPVQKKCFGLTIDPHRLHTIRQERRSNSRYADFEQCKKELRAVETLYRQHQIPLLNTTHYSIEEISTRILADTGLKRRRI